LERPRPISESGNSFHANGLVTITLTVGASGAGLVLFCYDVADVTTPGIMSSSGGSAGGTALSVPSFHITSGSFVIAMIRFGGASPIITPSYGFGLAVGTPVFANIGNDNNYVGEMWGTIASSSTTCAASNSISEDWGDLCFAFSP
jgi:hypothetical protein